MAFSFPLEIEHLDVPFTVIPNVNFPDVTPVCVVTNLGDAPALDRFIVTYTPPLPTTFPEDPDPWQIEFRWQTAGAPRNGIWVLDARLQSLTQGPNLHVPAVPPLPLLVPGDRRRRMPKLLELTRTPFRRQALRLPWSPRRR